MRWPVVLVGIFYSLVAFASIDRADAAVTVTKISYHGWKNCYQLSNKTIDLVVVPQIGRIMRFGFVGGRNMIWENPALAGVPANLQKPDWQNFGGDKLWPAPQSVWGWPPDPLLDRGTLNVQVLSNHHLVLTGPTSAKSGGIHFTREIAMDDTGLGVTLINVMTNTGAQAVEWSIWEVFQTNNPDVSRLVLHKDGNFPDGYYTFPNSAPATGFFNIAGNYGQLKRNPNQSCKIGSDSPTGILQSDEAGQRIQVSQTFEPGKNYPDSGCGQELYTNPDPLPYVEMELLSPIQTLKPNTHYSVTTRWKISRL